MLLTVLVEIAVLSVKVWQIAAHLGLACVPLLWGCV